MGNDNFTAVYKDDTMVDTYKIAEKITRLFAQDLVDLSGLIRSPLSPLVVLDNACGTGVISIAIHDTLQSQASDSWELTCGDISPGLVNQVQQKIDQEGWQNTKAIVVDAQDTGLRSGYFTHVFAAFAFTAFPDPKAAMKDCFRILQPGGTIAQSTWQLRAEWISILKSAVATMPGNLPFPNAKEFLSSVNAGWDTEDYTRSQLEEAGFSNVYVTTISKKFSRTIAEMVGISKPVVPVIVKRFWTETQRENHEKHILVALQCYLEDKYGVNGLVPQEWVGVFARGQKPF